MRAGGGKQKGNSFERDISKSLSLWWSNSERDDIFWRTQSSGGRATQRKKRGVTTNGQDGDISSTDPTSSLFTDKFVMECKRYKSIKIWNIISNKPCPFRDWWFKLKEQATSVSKRPLLIMREDRQSILCAMDADLFSIIKCSMIMYTIAAVECSVLNDKVVLIHFEDLLSLDAVKFMEIFNGELP